MSRNVAPSRRSASSVEVVAIGPNRSLGLAEVLDDEVAGILVILPRARGDLPGVPAGGFRVEELVAQVLDRGHLGFPARLAAGVQRVLLLQVFVQGDIGPRPLIFFSQQPLACGNKG
jgi:hypothetical protein